MINLPAIAHASKQQEVNLALKELLGTLPIAANAPAFPAATKGAAQLAKLMNASIGPGTGLADCAVLLQHA